MKNPIRLLLLSLLAGATTAHGAIAPLDVTVSASSGKLAYKGRTNANGTFATGNLEPGNYVVQFTAKDSAGIKDKQFAIVVSAGKHKVSAEAVEGKKFAAGGVAMKVDVGANMKLTGQVAASGEQMASKNDANVKVMNGKRYVWVGPEIGSQMPGRWVEEGSAAAASAQNSGRMSKDKVREIQSKGPPVLGGGGG